MTKNENQSVYMFQLRYLSANLTEDASFNIAPQNYKVAEDT